MTDFTPPFPPAPWPEEDRWADMSIEERKAWYEERHRAFFAAWALVAK